MALRNGRLQRTPHTLAASMARRAALAAWAVLLIAPAAPAQQSDPPIERLPQVNYQTQNEQPGQVAAPLQNPSLPQISQQQPPQSPEEIRLPQVNPQGMVPGAWPLPRAVAVAMQSNPVLRLAGARIESAQGDALQAGLYPNPRWDTNNPEVFAGAFSNYNAGFQQRIVVKGKLRMDVAAAKEVVRQKQLGMVQDRFDLLTDIRQQFYNVLALQRQLEISSEVLAITAASVQAAQGRVRATEGTVSEVLLLQTEYQRAEISLRNAQVDLSAGLRQLAAIIGRPDIRIPAVEGELISNFPEFDREALRGFVVSMNAQVQIARRDIQRNEILLRRAGPRCILTSRWVRHISTRSRQRPAASNTGLISLFRFPLGIAIRATFNPARGDVTDAHASLGVLQNDLLKQVDDALGRYQAARRTEERYRTQLLPTARRSADLLRDGYQKGIVPIATYLQAQRALIDASSQYIDAVKEVWKTAAELANLAQREQFP